MYFIFFIVWRDSDLKQTGVYCSFLIDFEYYILEAYIFLPYGWLRLHLTWFLSKEGTKTERIFKEFQLKLTANSFSKSNGR